eukprot:1884871-Amphidinium_carterae.1
MLVELRMRDEEQRSKQLVIHPSSTTRPHAAAGEYEANSGQHRNGRSMRLRQQQTKGDRRRVSQSFAALMHPKTVARRALCA